MRYLLAAFLVLFLISCQSQRELEYKKAYETTDINYLEKYIKKYPDDENIDELKYRLRVLEFEKVKNSKNIMLLSYFISKYKKGRDVEKAKDILFELKLKGNENNEEYLQHLKTEFNEMKYLKVLNDKIGRIKEDKLSIKNEIKTEEEKEEIIDFLEKYPQSKLHAKFTKMLKNYEFKKLFEQGNLDKINDFIRKNPEYDNKTTEEKLLKLMLSEYKKAPLNILEKFLETNVNNPNYKEIEEIYKERAYLQYIAFYDYDNLIKLDEKYHLKKYEDKVKYFKENEEKIKKIHKLIELLFKPLKKDKNIKDKIYFITKNTLEESKYIIQSAFVLSDVTPILKKVSSHFLLIKLSVLKALEYYYNKDIVNSRIEFYGMIKKLEDFKKSYYKEKILFLAFVLNDEKLFMKYLNELIIDGDKSVWTSFLKYSFLNGNGYELIDLLYDVSSMDFKVISSDDTIYKNKFDRKINLAIMKKILEFTIKNIKIKEDITRPKTVREIKVLRHYFNEIKDFDFDFVKNYEKSITDNFNKLQKTIKIDELLKNYIINHSPVTQIKYLLGEKCDIWCVKKKSFYSVFFD